MKIEMDEVITKLDEMPPLGDAPLIAVHDGSQETADRLRRIETAVKLIAIVIVVPAVLKLVLGVVGATVAAVYVSKYGHKALPMLRKDFPKLKTAETLAGMNAEPRVVEAT